MHKFLATQGENLKKTKIAKEEMEEFKKKVFEQMQYAMEINDISQNEMAAILDTTGSHLNKCRGRNSLPLELFILFCRVFGFDISSGVILAKWESLSTPQKELVVLIDRLNSRTLNSMIDVVQKSNDDTDRLKEDVTILLTAIAEKKDNDTLDNEDDI